MFLSYAISGAAIGPLISGAVAIAVAVLAAGYQRGENLKATRIRAYEQLESALREWAESKNDTTVSGVFYAANVVRIVGSQATSELALQVSEWVHDHPDGLSKKQFDRFSAVRRKLLDSMRADVRSRCIFYRD